MRSRIFFLAVAGFWVVMNYLLWRSQYGGHSSFGSSVPLETVWNKILTAPDNSALDIYDHGEKAGFGHWTAGYGESPMITSRILSQDFRPGPTEKKPPGYSLSFEGSVAFNVTNRYRFQSKLTLDTNEMWSDLHVRVGMLPKSWEIHAVAKDQKVDLTVNDDMGSWSKTYKFADLQDPQGAFEEFGDGFALSLMGLNKNFHTGLGAGLKWEAHEDRMSLGQSEMRVYRLDSFFLGRKIEIYVSRVGEILWVNLPYKFSLRNQAFAPYNNTVN